jgi:hypothetical protein
MMTLPTAHPNTDTDTNMSIDGGVIVHHGGYTLRPYVWHDRLCWLTAELSQIVGGQAHRRLRNWLGTERAVRFVPGLDYERLQGRNVSIFKQINSIEDNLGVAVDVLFEPGVHAALAVSSGPASHLIRRAMAERVFPQLAAERREPAGSDDAAAAGEINEKAAVLRARELDLCEREMAGRGFELLHAELMASPADERADDDPTAAEANRAANSGLIYAAARGADYAAAYGAVSTRVGPDCIAEFYSEFMELGDLSARAKVLELREREMVARGFEVLRTRLPGLSEHERRRLAIMQAEALTGLRLRDLVPDLWAGADAEPDSTSMHCN